MLVTVMMLSAAILSATTLVALLVRFQLRQASDIKASTQAIFAADSGIECVLYEKFKGTPDYTKCGDGGEVALGNGVIYTVIVSPGGDVFKSVGRSGRATRAFEISL